MPRIDHGVLCCKHNVSDKYGNSCKEMIEVLFCVEIHQKQNRCNWNLEKRINLLDYLGVHVVSINTRNVVQFCFVVTNQFLYLQTWHASSVDKFNVSMEYCLENLILQHCNWAYTLLYYY